MIPNFHTELSVRLPTMSCQSRTKKKNQHLTYQYKHLFEFSNQPLSINMNLVNHKLTSGKTYKWETDNYLVPTDGKHEN